MTKLIKKYIFPILVVIGVVIDMTTNLFKDLFNFMNIPSWASTGIRMLIALCAIARLYYTLVMIEAQNNDNEKSS